MFLMPSSRHIHRGPSSAIFVDPNCEACENVTSTVTIHNGCGCGSNRCRRRDCCGANIFPLRANTESRTICDAETMRVVGLLPSSPVSEKPAIRTIDFQIVSIYTEPAVSESDTRNRSTPEHHRHIHNLLCIFLSLVFYQATAMFDPESIYTVNSAICQPSSA